MLVKEFRVIEDIKLSVAIKNFELSLDYNSIQKIIRNKDVKVNDKRQSKDIMLHSGDVVQFYFKEERKIVDVVYEDDNILVASKPKELETISDEVSDSLLIRLVNQMGLNLYAVHRLDRNTTGLVVFAKNLKTKNELDLVFKNRTIEKYYLALVNGHFKEKQNTLIAYLKKDSKNSLVYISNEKLEGYEKIETKYKVLEEYEDTSLIEVKLVTGKTHQIRAHLAHIGHFVIGDQKYGDSKVNQKFKKKYQCLTAYKIKFHFDKNSVLSYLNNKEIVLPKEKLKILSKNK